MAARQPSFRLRIALLTAGITGLILIICGSLAWMLLYRQLEKSVDLAISDPGRLLAHRLHAESDWAELEQFWDRVFGGQTEWDQLILIKTNTGEFVFSTNNAAGFPLDRLDPFLPEDGTFADAELMRKKAPHWREGRGGRPPRFLGSSSGEQQGGPRRRPTRRSEPRSFWVDLEDKPRFFAIQNEGIRWRMGAFSNPDVTIFVGANLADFDADVRQSRSYFLLALPIGLLATAGLGWLVSRQATNPVARISLTASQMTARGLGQRIPLRGNETAEFAQLIQAFNEMMERLERGFHQATRFTADASHELKTPIALMQAELEDSLKQVEPDSPTEQSLLHLQSEVQRLKGITQRLLLLSQADAGQLKLTKERYSLSEDLDALCEDGEVLCAKEGLRFESDVADGIEVEADRVLLNQAIQNLLNNAIKYNEPEGWVKATLHAEADNLRITFSNSGEGISPDHQDKIFSRFYRIDSARGREVDGFGLGLNLALEIIRAHGGQLLLKKASDEKTCFEIQLPLPGAPKT